MNNFISRFAHWILLLFVGLSFIMGFSLFTISIQGLIAGVFGIVGLIGVAFVVFQIEKQKRGKAK
ncbi:MAG: hypothetical protein ACQET6_02360 [Bacillota bacterium]|uniref:hypothetical protein n=1 Tax=Rossellomorea sp. FM04394 TaxID=3243076 RepID=UPI0035A62523